jgi:hypothetical protein
MKRIIFVAAFIAVASAFAFGQKDEMKTKVMLIQMDKAWTAAELRGDLKEVSTYIAEDFWGTNTSGVMQNKAQYMADLKASKDTDTADDYAVRFFGPDLAIMTHRGTVKGEHNLQYRSTHVWVNRGGKWQIVAHHGTDIAAESAGGAKAAEAPTQRKAPKIAAMAPAADEARPTKKEE